MSFDVVQLEKAVARHGVVVRVVVAGHKGSAPREAGASMLVWPGGQSGTIGGGALEWEAARHARDMLGRGTPLRLDRLPLGPALGQCCGGAVVLVSERWDVARLEALGGGPVVARPVSAGVAAEPPFAVRRLLARARAQGLVPAPAMVAGWLVEPVHPPQRALWIWGAGHVGRALVAVLDPIPEFAITWVDTAPERFAGADPGRALMRVAAAPAELVAEAPADGEHLIVTYSHALDLELCHRLLDHGFVRAGLIGSASKWARFRARLRALGHPDAAIARIDCPIGDPALGKHPHVIALGVACALVAKDMRATGAGERAG